MFRHRLLRSGSVLTEVTIYSGLAVMMLGFLLKVVLDGFYEGDTYGLTARRCLKHAIEDNSTPDDAVGVGGYFELARAMGSVGAQAGVDLKKFQSACFASVGTRLTLNYTLDPSCSASGLGVGKHFAYSNSASETGRQGDVGCLARTFANNDFMFGGTESKTSFNDSTYANAGDGVTRGAATADVAVNYSTNTQLGALSSSASASGGTSGESNL